MSAHRSRSDMALNDPVRFSSVDGETFEPPEEWGLQIVVNSAGAETRNLPVPHQAGLRMDVVAGTVVGAVTLAAPSGQDFDGLGGDEALLAVAGEWIIFESWWIAGTYEWRVTAKHANVEVA